MYKLDHAPDPTACQAIDRRRRLDRERMQRIFDPKVRIMGIDVQALEDQIHIKSEAKAIEAERNQTADRVALETNELLQMLDAKVAASRRTAQRSIDAFRKDHQQPPTRRDYDLYDPLRLKNDRPARESDADPRTTVATLQRFEGEDLEHGDRLKAQQRQMQVWVWQKMRDEEARKLREEEELQRREEEVMQNNAKIQLLMEHERQERRRVAREDAEFNLKLAQEKKLREAEHAQKETTKNLDEIARNLTGDFLTERPAPGQPGPHRIRIDAFKGMSPEQIAEIRATRERQIAEAKERAEKQARDEQAWAKHQFWVSRAAVLMEREKHRAERARERQVLAENHDLASEFKHRLSFLDKVVYTNPPTEDYFSQFNTTSR